MDDEEEDQNPRQIPEEEVHLLEDFLDKFVFSGDSSSSKEQIDISLVLKALPNRITPKNIYRVDLLNFSMI